MSEPAVRIDHLSKKFRLYHERNLSVKSVIARGRRSIHEDLWALQDVSFDVPEGSTFGLVGSNGSGKSTLLKCLAKIYYPESGSITANGRLAAMLEVGSGFHPELTGRDNIYLNGSILGMSKKTIERKFDEIVDFSGVEQYLDQPVKNYSSGMYVRLGFSVAISVDPDILVVDEVLAVGDIEFQAKCFSKFASFKDQGKTVIVVTHSTETLLEMCDSAAWLDRGTLKYVGSAKQAMDNYLNSIHSDEAPQ